MFLDIFDQPRQDLLKKILSAPPVVDSYLAGGTALALMLGHRQSIDFGWFSSLRFSGEVITEELSQLGELQIGEIKEGTFHGFLDGIQVTWLYYPNPLLEALVTSPAIPDLRLASLLDIGVMKWSALSSRGSRKDFIDLYFLAQAGIEIQTLLPYLSQKFPNTNINYYHMVKSLTYFDDAEAEAWPVMLKPAPWEDIKNYFQQQQKLMLAADICTQARNHLGEQQ